MIFLNRFFKGTREWENTVKLLEASMFKKAVSQSPIQLVDVRTPREYHSGHMKNAVNIDLFDRGNFEKSFGRFNKEKPIYIYCRSGARSRKAARRLVEMGFVKIYDLKGGYMRWRS